MALLSVKNFLEPLTNKLHLGLIVFVVALFAVFRAAGGALSLSSPPPPRASVNEREPSVERGYRDSGAEQRPRNFEMPTSINDISPGRNLSKLGVNDGGARPNARADSSGTEADLLDSMIGGESVDRSGQVSPDQADLDEVERRLGLR